MDITQKMGRSRLIEEVKTPQKYKLKDGVIHRNHLDSELLLKWDAIAENAIYLNYLQEFLNQMNNAISVKGNVTQFAKEGVTKVVLTFNTYKSFTGQLQVDLYRSKDDGSGFVGLHTFFISPDDLTVDGVNLVWVQPTTGEQLTDIIYDSSNLASVVYLVKVVIDGFEYVGKWIVGRNNYNVTTNEVWDDDFGMTQADINKQLIRTTLSVNLSMTGMNTSVVKGTTHTPTLLAKSSSDKATIKIYRKVGDSEVCLVSGTGGTVSYSESRIFDAETTYYAVVSIGNFMVESSRIKITVTTPVVINSYVIYYGTVSSYSGNIDEIAQSLSTKTVKENSWRNTEFVINTPDTSEYVVFAIPTALRVENFIMSGTFVMEMRDYGVVRYHNENYNIYFSPEKVLESIELKIKIQ